MSDEGRTYEKGMVDAVKIWAETCGGMSCEECSIGIVRGADVTCQEFAKKFPEKFITLLREQHEGGNTFAQEFALRFPESGLTAEELVSVGMCRKLIFNGDATCEEPSTKCEACWKSIYGADGGE